jgi:hypothetical protein
LHSALLLPTGAGRRFELTASENGPRTRKDAGAFFWSSCAKTAKEQTMKKQHQIDSANEPPSKKPAEVAQEDAANWLDYRGVLERVREEFQSGMTPDGVQRGFR